MLWTEYISQIENCLTGMSAFDNAAQSISIDDAFSLWSDATISTRKQRGTVFLIGNGASASMASHVAADLAKNGHIHTEVFSDPSLITAIANDLGYDEVFAEPIRHRMKIGDMLIVISSSGRSVNVINAAKEATAIGGAVVTLSAMEANNPLSRMGKLNFYLPAETYGLAETCHAAVLHRWIDEIVEKNSE